MVGFDKRRYRPGRRIVVPNIANTGACRPIHADKHEDKTEDFEETEIPFRFLRSKKSHNTVVEITDPLRPIVGIDFFDIAIDGENGDEESQDDSRMMHGKMRGERNAYTQVCGEQQRCGFPA